MNSNKIWTKSIKHIDWVLFKKWCVAATFGTIWFDWVFVVGNTGIAGNIALIFAVDTVFGLL